VLFEATGHGCETQVTPRDCECAPAKVPAPVTSESNGRTHRPEPGWRFVSAAVPQLRDWSASACELGNHVARQRLVNLRAEAFAANERHERRGAEQAACGDDTMGAGRSIPALCSG
jgi:hypothetical protein